MQGIPENFLLDGYPPFLLQETDTATPRTPIPVYYIHTLTHPFCSNTLCACHRNMQDVTRLLGGLVEGTLLLHDAASLTQAGEEAMSDSTGTTPTTHSIHGAEGMPVLCQLYGHSWQETEHPDVKECRLCGIRGYCPGCTPIAPQSAHPFFCTTHSRQSEVQP
jgi:hypothetical protein